MPAIHRQSLVQLIAAGFTAAQIGSRLGVTAQAVAEACEADEQLAYDVARAKTYKEIDDNIDDIEKLATQKLKRALQFETDSMKLLKVATGMNQMRRRSQGENAGLINQEAHSKVVKISLPQRIAVTYQTNQNSEVVEVNGRTLVSMPAQQLLQKVRKESAEKKDESESYELQSITDLL